NTYLPSWIQPNQAFSLEFANLTIIVINSAIRDNYNDIETILKLVGSAALVQFASKKLLNR
ncbi:hypothetical protein MTR_8g011220, partial [Medicago truncatula]